MIDKAEQRRLSKIYQVIEKELESAKSSIQFSDAMIREQNRDMWENTGIPSGSNDTGRLVSVNSYLDSIEQSKRALGFVKKRHAVLGRMLMSAYFGRVDFLQNEAAMPNEIYIGVGSLSDEKTGDLLVYDWRAPICSVFYDSDIGAAHYVSPLGIVKGEMLRRRQFKIEYDKILLMIDSLIKIDDEILMQMLSGNSGTYMRSIVMTIQREQNRVIRNEKSDVMIAIGPAGSGKTSVALHRIAYILYREKDRLNYKDILILTPNSIFSEYISRVLPQLGEENVGEYRITDIVGKLFTEYGFESYKSYMETILLNRDAARRKNIRIKTSLGYLEKLDGYIVSLNKKLTEFSDISYAGNVIVSAAELGEMYDSNQNIFSPRQRLERMGRRVEGIARKYKLAEFEAHYKNILEASEYYTPMEAKKLAGINVGRIFSEVDRKIDEMTNVDWTKYYLGFVKDDFPEVFGITSKRLERKYLMQEDIVPFAYFLQEMGSGLSMSNIKHVIIDELQDYPYISIKYLSKVFGNARFTLLGDQNQTLCKIVEAYDPQKHHEMFKNMSVELIKLNKSYRSSYEIFEFCRKILKDDIYDSSAVDRHENIPEVICLGDGYHEQISDIAKGARDEGYKTIAIITKTESLASVLFEKSSQMAGKVNFVDSEDGIIKNDINIIPSYFAKGLEFDCVIVPDAGNEEYSDEEDRGVLYTVCSRALHKLVVCYKKKPSKFLPLQD